MKEDKNQPINLDNYRKEWMPEINAYKHIATLDSKSMQETMQAAQEALDRSRNFQKDLLANIDTRGIRQAVEAAQLFGGRSALQLNKELADTVASIRNSFAHGSTAVKEMPSSPSASLMPRMLANPARELLQEHEETNDLLEKQLKMNEKHLEETRKIQGELVTLAAATVKSLDTLQIHTSVIEKDIRDRKKGEHYNKRRGRRILRLIERRAKLRTIQGLAPAWIAAILAIWALVRPATVTLDPASIAAIQASQALSGSLNQINQEKRKAKDSKESEKTRRKKKSNALLTESGSPITTQNGKTLVTK